MDSLIPEQMFAQGNAMYKRSMEIYGKAAQQASLLVAVASAIIPTRRAEADYARKQPVSYPNRQIIINYVPALEGILSINQEQLRTVAQERQEYIDHQPARATDDFVTYTDAKFDKFFHTARPWRQHGRRIPEGRDFRRHDVARIPSDDCDYARGG